MSSPVDSEHTFKPPDPKRPAQRPTPSLTILFHPDPTRIGQRARLTELLEGKSVALSRSTPDFCAPGEAQGEPLADIQLSRRPVRLGWDAKGRLVVSAGETGMEVRAGQRLVEKAIAFSTDELDDGVVLELADRVVLLLHVLRRAIEPGPALGLVGANEAIEELRRGILRVADLSVSVLIRGETGTGKELVARAVHDASARANAPFVAVNMAAIPESTAASELFGHARGAFTGATGEHAGYFGDAEGGTLFLDEIGATPAQIQPMLLRVLESQEIQPLGSSNPRKVDVRIIAATDADLEQSTADESFRAALLHRLEGFQIFLPPLRKRRDDIGRLLLHFLRADLDETGEPHRLVPAQKGDPTWLPAALVGRVTSLEWPGNVRQLRNFVRQLVISNRGAEIAEVDAAVERLLTTAGGQAPEPIAPPPSAGPQRSPSSIADDEMIAELRANDWQVNRAATALGISRSALYERMKACASIRMASEIPKDEILAAQQGCDGDLAATARKLDVSKRALRTRMKELGIE